MKVWKIFYNFAALFIVFLVGGSVYSSVITEQGIKVLHPPRAIAPPKLDGVLNDEVWKSGPIVDDVFLTYNPTKGEVLPQKTRVWMTYDHDNLYFAFYCHDTEPGRIKTSLTRRDMMFADDWVGFSLDSMGNKQSGYEFFVNPNGIQGDIYRNGTNEDWTTDWVWYSGGKIVSDGYIVEVRVPLKSIRFTSGENVKMNIMFWRRISRLGTSGSWPEIKPGEGVVNSYTGVIYGKLNNQLQLEFLPSVTYGSIWNREQPQKWNSADSNSDLGFGVKYGITSSITAEITVNPDFSQVESDAFQVVVNQRYPIFYNEKRPFFMEVGNYYNLAGTGHDYNLINTVHTRRIVDPDWGAKLSGEMGKFSFGFLASGDAWAGRIWSEEEVEDEGGPNPNEGKNATFVIGRSRFSLGGDQYIGALYVERSLAEGSNRVGGADFRYRLGKGHVFSGNVLYTLTRDASTKEEKEGGAVSLSYDYYQKGLGYQLSFQHFDRDFQMDTAFYQRTGFTRIGALLAPEFFPDKEKISWLKTVTPVFWGYYLRDVETGEDDYFYLLGVRMNFVKQGFLGLDYRNFSEFWEGERLEGAGFLSFGGVQMTKWLRISGFFRIGDGVYYDSDAPQVGDSLNLNFDVSINLNGNLQQEFGYVYQRLDSKIDGERLYDVNIFRSRTTYQFTKFLFVRASVQYDSYQEIILTDLLASFTLVPGTVLHVGYGSLHENLGWDNEKRDWADEGGLNDYYQMRQSLFLKVSYLWRL